MLISTEQTTNQSYLNGMWHDDFNRENKEQKYWTWLLHLPGKTIPWLFQDFWRSISKFQGTYWWISLADSPSLSQFQSNELQLGYFAVKLKELLYIPSDKLHWGLEPSKPNSLPFPDFHEKSLIARSLEIIQPLIASSHNYIAF